MVGIVGTLNTIINVVETLTNGSEWLERNRTESFISTSSSQHITKTYLLRMYFSVETLGIVLRVK